jgi:hypothetical protein
LRFGVVFCLAPLVGWRAALAAAPITEPYLRTAKGLEYLLLSLPFILIGAVGLIGWLCGLCLWKTFFPPRFDAGSDGGNITYQFRDQRYAAHFAQENGIRLPPDWKTSSYSPGRLVEH